jgi:hypothetical protein
MIIHTKIFQKYLNKEVSIIYLLNGIIKKMGDISDKKLLQKNNRIIRFNR